MVDKFIFLQFTFLAILDLWDQVLVKWDVMLDRRKPYFAGLR